MSEKTKQCFVLKCSNLQSDSCVYNTKNMNCLKRTSMERSLIRLHFAVCPIIKQCFISVISCFSPQYLELISKSCSLSLFTQGLWSRAWFKRSDKRPGICLEIHVWPWFSRSASMTFSIIAQLGGTFQRQSLETVCYMVALPLWIPRKLPSIKVCTQRDNWMAKSNGRHFFRKWTMGVRLLSHPFIFECPQRTQLFGLCDMGQSCSRCITFN